MTLTGQSPIYGMLQAKLDAIDNKMSLEDVKSGKGPWTERDRIILRIVDEQLTTYTNEPEIIMAARRILTVGQLVEVLITLGTYALIARVIRGLKIDDNAEIPDLEDMLSCEVEMNLLDNFFGPPIFFRHP